MKGAKPFGYLQLRRCGREVELGTIERDSSPNLDANEVTTRGPCLMLCYHDESVILL